MSPSASPLILLIGPPPGLQQRVIEAARGEGSVITTPSLAEATAWLLHAAGGGEPAPRRLQVGGLVIDLDRHEVTWYGKPIRVTRQEFAILTALAERPGIAISSRDLIRRVWQETHRADNKVVRAAMRRLRATLDREDVSVRIESIRGHGYRIGPDSAPLLRVVR